MKPAPRSGSLGGALGAGSSLHAWFFMLCGCWLVLAAFVAAGAAGVDAGKAIAGVAGMIALLALLGPVYIRLRRPPGAGVAGAPPAVAVQPEPGTGFALALRGSNDGFWEWELATGALRVSERWRELLGVDGPVVRIGDWWRQFPDDDLKKFRRMIVRALRARATQTFSAECRMRVGEQGTGWFLVRGCIEREGDGKPLRLAGSLTDITGRKAAERNLGYRAYHDPLTGLPNRAFFLRRLERVVRKRSTDGDYAVLFLDLDRFKLVNDSLGHGAGDELLVAITNRLHGCLRPEDLFSRLGGDEFVIIAEGITSVGIVSKIADRIHEQFASPFTIVGQEIYSSVSIGIAMGAMGYERAEDVLRDADTAMYRAKTHGSARFVLFDQEMHAQAFQTLQIETDLRHAIDREQLHVEYQPIVDLDSGALEGFEALARWHRPETGAIAPAVFIPVAESSGAITDVGSWVLRTACLQAASWQRHSGRRDLQINVNISPLQFAGGHFIEQLSAVLEESGLAPHTLCLEITESAMMESGYMLKAQMEAIRCLGVRLLIDDFGTGYSALSALQQYPIDGLKIDRAFVSRLGGSEEHAAIVRTITALAAHLGLSVTAEGLENEDQLAQVRLFGCERGQGYLFSKPLAAEQAGAMLVSGTAEFHDGRHPPDKLAE